MPAPSETPLAVIEWELRTLFNDYLVPLREENKAQELIDALEYAGYVIVPKEVKSDDEQPQDPGR